MKGTPIYDARREAQRIVRTGLEPYLTSLGLQMPPPGRVRIPRDELPVVFRIQFLNIRRATRLAGVKLNQRNTSKGEAL